VFTVVVAAVELVEDEPQALTSAAQASTVAATLALRRGETARVVLKAGFSICMRAY
jgi:hypothetical protein